VRFHGDKEKAKKDLGLSTLTALEE